MTATPYIQNPGGGQQQITAPITIGRDYSTLTMNPGDAMERLQAMRLGRAFIQQQADDSIAKSSSSLPSSPRMVREVHGFFREFPQPSPTPPPSPK